MLWNLLSLFNPSLRQEETCHPPSGRRILRWVMLQQGWAYDQRHLSIQCHAAPSRLRVKRRGSTIWVSTCFLHHLDDFDSLLNGSVEAFWKRRCKFFALLFRMKSILGSLEPPVHSRCCTGTTDCLSRDERSSIISLFSRDSFDPALFFHLPPYVSI